MTPAPLVESDISSTWLEWSKTSLVLPTMPSGVTTAIPLSIPLTEPRSTKTTLELAPVPFPITRAATVFQVVQDQRDLATSQSTEVQAMANYTHARISFDQALGTTLDENHISLDEAMKGRLARDSALPANLPGVKPGVQQ